MRGVHAELGGIKRRARPLERVARIIAARTDVICVDEFFVADIADAMILAGLFAGLFRRGVTLIATSNQAPQDLYKEGLQRQRFLPAIALIESHVEVLHLDGGTDYRLRQLERAPTYLDANLPQTPAALEERFAALAGASTAGSRPGPAGEAPPRFVVLPTAMVRPPAGCVDRGTRTRSPRRGSPAARPW